MIDSELFSGASSPKREQAQFFLATVAGVYSDGIVLRIDGAETKKHYLVNASQSFSVGDRVKVAKISGTYIVEYKIGKPQ